jgi:hypothetical protein
MGLGEGHLAHLRRAPWRLRLIVVRDRGEWLLRRKHVISEASRPLPATAIAAEAAREIVEHTIDLTPKAEAFLLLAGFRIASEAANETAGHGKFLPCAGLGIPSSVL